MAYYLSLPEGDDDLIADDYTVERLAMYTTFVLLACILVIVGEAHILGQCGQAHRPFLANLIMNIISSALFFGCAIDGLIYVAADDRDWAIWVTVALSVRDER